MALNDPDGLDELRTIRQQLVTLRPPRAPWPTFVREDCFTIWSGRGNRDAGRTARLYQLGLPEEVPGPSPSTVRHWARHENWAAWADGVPPSLRQDPQAWVTAWLRTMTGQLTAALQLQHRALQGRCAADSVTASASMEQFLRQPGARAFLQFALRDDAPQVPLPERERLLRRRLRRALASAG